MRPSSLSSLPPPREGFCPPSLQGTAAAPVGSRDTGLEVGAAVPLLSPLCCTVRRHGAKHPHRRQQRVCPGAVTMNFAVRGQGLAALTRIQNKKSCRRFAAPPASWCKVRWLPWQHRCHTLSPVSSCCHRLHQPQLPGCSEQLRPKIPELKASRCWRIQDQGLSFAAPCRALGRARNAKECCHGVAAAELVGLAGLGLQRGARLGSCHPLGTSSRGDESWTGWDKGHPLTSPGGCAPAPGQAAGQSGVPLVLGCVNSGRGPAAGSQIFGPVYVQQGWP